ncbi:NAD(P)H-binding protein [Nonomuraea sp. NPDC050790]|uniref:NAD(P)H-binding protein n=1 Tax=Nonomuraea sp. NPDC050790 TaxID=3364371 RepID=UPI00378C66D7
MYVVTGATGNVGRALVHSLHAAGEPVTAVARRIDAAGLPEGVRTTAADLTDPATLGPALRGAEAVFLMVPPTLAPEADAAVMAAVKEAGVGRVVVLSSQSAATRPDSAGHGLRMRHFEDEAKAAGLGWTVIRPGGFASNAYAWAESVRTRRAVFAPFADVPLPVIHPDDIAEVGAAALREPAHDGRTYVLTGPELITVRRMAAELGQALGEEIAFTELTRAEAKAGMLAFMPEAVAEGTLNILGTPTAEEQRISPDVRRVLGREPRSFAAWAGQNAAAFGLSAVRSPAAP